MSRCQIVNKFECQNQIWTSQILPERQIILIDAHLGVRMRTTQAAGSASSWSGNAMSSDTGSNSGDVSRARELLTQAVQFLDSSGGRNLSATRDQRRSSPEQDQL